MYIVKQLLSHKWTYIPASSTQMSRQRLNEEIFLRMPMKAFGGTGKLGREKLSSSIYFTAWTCSSDDNTSCSLISAKYSGEIQIRRYFWNNALKGNKIKIL